MHWFCPLCDKKAVRSIKSDREVEERCDAFLGRMENRVKCIETELASMPSREEVRNIVTSEVERQHIDAIRLTVREEINSGEALLDKAQLQKMVGLEQCKAMMIAN